MKLPAHVQAMSQRIRRDLEHINDWFITHSSKLKCLKVKDLTLHEITSTLKVLSNQLRFQCKYFGSCMERGVELEGPYQLRPRKPVSVFTFCEFFVGTSVCVKVRSP